MTLRARLVFCLRWLVVQSRLLVFVIFLLNIVHPFIHGTFLDGGGLDVGIQYLDCWAMSLMSSPTPLEGVSHGNDH